MSADHAGKGVVALYRWRVTQDAEEAFRADWRETTAWLRTRGSLGSALCRASEGEWIGVAFWSVARDRDAAFAAMPERETVTGVERIESVAMDVIEDMWLISPFGGRTA